MAVVFKFATWVCSCPVVTRFGSIESITHLRAEALPGKFKESIARSDDAPTARFVIPIKPIKIAIIKVTLFLLAEFNQDTNYLLLGSLILKTVVSLNEHVHFQKEKEGIKDLSTSEQN